MARRKLTGARKFALLAAAMTLAAWQPAQAQEAEPANWPQIASPDALTDAETEAMITRLIARMSLEEKIGQMIQADIASIVPEDLRRYPLGSVLAGGSSAPLGKPDRSPGRDWADTAMAFERVAMEQRQGHVAIPLLFGVDAVHGNNNIVGATLFPHNIGLGAARDPDLIRRIGLATAREAAAAGVNWTFAPTVAVPQDDRWGRTYEGYSEDPAIVRAYAGEMTRGLQGEPGEGTIQDGYIAGSAKAFPGRRRNHRRHRPRRQCRDRAGAGRHSRRGLSPRDRGGDHVDHGLVQFVAWPQDAR